MNLEDYSNDNNVEDVITLALEHKVKAEQEKLEKEKEFHLKFLHLKECFQKLSLPNKKHYILSLLEQSQYENVLEKIFSYISMSFTKIYIYSHVKSFRTSRYQQVLIDSNTSLLQDCHQWILNLNEEKQFKVLVDLFMLCDSGFVTQCYWEVSKIFYRRKLAFKNLNEINDQNIFDDCHLDDTDKYPHDHELSIEVEKMRKNWKDMMQKYHQEIIAEDKNQTKNKKSKTSPESQDWLQLLPIWIVKYIFNYLDQKTLQSTVKKVNPFWKYASESVLKERQCRNLLDQTIDKMIKDIDFNILNSSNDYKIPTNTFKMKQHYRVRNPGAVYTSMTPIDNENTNEILVMNNTPSSFGEDTPIYNLSYNLFNTLSIDSNATISDW